MRSVERGRSGNRATSLSFAFSSSTFYFLLSTLYSLPSSSHHAIDLCKWAETCKWEERRGCSGGEHLWSKVTSRANGANVSTWDERMQEGAETTSSYFLPTSESTSDSERKGERTILTGPGRKKTTSHTEASGQLSLTKDNLPEGKVRELLEW